jgi:hypothetical protein
MLRSRLLVMLFVVALIVLVVIVVTALTPPPSVIIQWSTASELNTAGFNVYRGENQDGPFTQVNTELIPASTDPLVGGSYVFTDTNVVAGKNYYYKLEDVETSGAKSDQGTVQVTAEGGVNPMPLIGGGVVAVLIAGLMPSLRRKRALPS